MKTAEMIETLKGMGAKVWESGNMKRLYLNGAAKVLIGFEYETYKTGNISSATLNGESISNSTAKTMAATIENAKIYYDFKDGAFHFKTGYGINSDYAKDIIAAARALEIEE